MAGPHGRTPAEAAAPPPRPKAAVPDGPDAPQPAPDRQRAEEPVWLVRIVLLLFLVGFAAFLAREVRFAIETLP